MVPSIPIIPNTPNTPSSKEEINRYCYQCTYYRPYPNDGNCHAPQRNAEYSSKVTGGTNFLYLVNNSDNSISPIEWHRHVVCKGDWWSSRRIADALFYMNNPSQSKKGIS